MAESTKKLLAETLKEMLLTKPLDKVTVCELTKRCGVNRQTFYYHFQDMYDLVGWIYVSESREVIGRSISKDSWKVDVLELLCYLQDNHLFVTNTYHSLSKEHLERFSQNRIEQILLHTIEQTPHAENVSMEHKQYIASFYTYALSGIILDWVSDDMRKSPQQIVDELEIMLTGNLQKVMDRFLERERSEK